MDEAHVVRPGQVGPYASDVDLQGAAGTEDRERIGEASMAAEGAEERGGSMRAICATAIATVAFAFLSARTDTCAAGRSAVEESGVFRVRFDRVENDRLALKLDVSGMYDSNRDERLSGAELTVNIGGVEFAGTADGRARIRTDKMRARLVEKGSALSIKIRNVTLRFKEGESGEEGEEDYSEFAEMERNTYGETKAVPLSVYITATKDGSTSILYDGTLVFLYKADGMRGTGVFSSRP